MSAVDHPPHYTKGGIEAIDVIEAWGLGFHLGNALKYIARAGRKGDAREDIAKAIWYLSRWVDLPIEETQRIRVQRLTAMVNRAKPR